MYNETIYSLGVVGLLVAFSYRYLKGLQRIQIKTAYVLVLTTFLPLGLSIIQTIAYADFVDKLLFAILAVYSVFAIVVSIKYFRSFNLEMRKQYYQSGNFVFWTLSGILCFLKFLFDFVRSR